MKFNLPEQAFVNKFIPKSKFFEKLTLSNKSKENISESIKRITWLYKIAETTIGVTKTDSVDEIQIFQIEVKDKLIPFSSLKIIDKAIPYPILYYITFDINYCFVIATKSKEERYFYYSDWNDNLNFDFSGTNLKIVYENIIKKFVKIKAGIDEGFDTLIDRDIQIKKLEKELIALDDKIQKELQFNKKAEIHKKFLEIKEKLNNLKI